jgi:hypothetical protein
VRVVYLGHACHLVEADGVRLLIDPWLTDPIFEGLIERDPPLAFSVADLPAIDAVAISHAHLDHMNAPTLAALPERGIPIVHPHDRFVELGAALRALGFEDLHPLRDWESFELGGLRITATPSLGVLDECAYMVESRRARFFDGADAPQPPELIAQIAARFGPVELGAFSHNAFDMPALLGLPSHKPADHGIEGGVRAARGLGARAAVAAASNMRWCGDGGERITSRVIRRSREDFLARLARDAPEVEPLPLAPGDAWSREGGVERGALRGKPGLRTDHDYVHAFLGTGARWCPPGRPSTEDTLRRDLPARTATDPDASRYVAQPVAFEITGDDPARFCVDFRTPGAPPERGDGAPFVVRIDADDWKDLFERRVPWQVLLSSDRLRVLRFRPGPPPDGLHFVYALQAIFP